MNIIGLSNKDSGCGYHRVVLPLGFMQGINGYVTNWITENRIQYGPDDNKENWDILIYNRLCPYDQVWENTRDLLNCKIVLDLDDYWKLPVNHLNFDHYEMFGARIENNIREADMVTVTNEALASKVRPFNSNVHVFPNALPFGRNQFIEGRRESDKIRIFWCGGCTHEHDLALLRYPLSKLKAYKDKILMVLGGWTDSDEVSKKIWQRMFSSFTAGGTLPHLKLPSTRPIEYMQMYEHADIMVIPLEDSEWHACKSNLKILEAASRRVPVIVSNVAPYNQDPEAPVLWVNSQKDWFTHLNYLINNPISRIELGNKLYDWAKQKYNLADVNERRTRAFESLCKTQALCGVLS